MLIPIMIRCCDSPCWESPIIPDHYYECPNVPKCQHCKGRSDYGYAYHKPDCPVISNRNKCDVCKFPIYPLNGYAHFNECRYSAKCNHCGLKMGHTTDEEMIEIIIQHETNGCPRLKK